VHCAISFRFGTSVALYFITNEAQMKRQKQRNIYLQMQSFATTTKTLLIQGNMLRVNKCIGMIEQLFVNGNIEVRNAISNVYLYSLTSFMEMHRYHIKDLLPLRLQEEYYKQINTSSI
jgi:hypothetical protein